MAHAEYGWIGRGWDAGSQGLFLKAAARLARKVDAVYRPPSPPSGVVYLAPAIVRWAVEGVAPSRALRQLANPHTARIAAPQQVLRYAATRGIALKRPQILGIENWRCRPDGRLILVAQRQGASGCEEAVVREADILSKRFDPSYRGELASGRQRLAVPLGCLSFEGGVPEDINEKLRDDLHAHYCAQAIVTTGLAYMPPGN